MQSQALEAFIRHTPDPLLDRKQQADAQHQHLCTFAAAITAKASTYPVLEQAGDLATLLLTAVSFKLAGSKKIPDNDQLAIEALKQAQVIEIVSGLLCNDHTTHYLAKAVKSDYDNLYLRPPAAVEQRHGLSSDGLHSPTLLNLFHLQGAPFYSFYCTLFYFRERLYSGFEAVMGDPCDELRQALHQQLIAKGLQGFSTALAAQSDALARRQHPTHAQGKQMAFPRTERALRDQDYVVVTPAPAISLIYALDHAVDKQARQGVYRFEKMKLGGNNPVNMGSAVLNLSRGSGASAHNLRPLRAYVFPLSKRLYFSEEVLRHQRYEYASALNFDDLQVMQYLRTPLNSKKDFTVWVSLLPAALFQVIRPLADLRACADAGTLDLRFKYEIEQDFVCKTLYEDLLGRSIDRNSYARLAQHVADRIEARLLRYKGFNAGLGVVRKKTIVRIAEMVGRKLL
jgi:hypothetical protein